MRAPLLTRRTNGLGIDRSSENIAGWAPAHSACRYWVTHAWAEAHPTNPFVPAFRRDRSAASQAAHTTSLPDSCAARAGRRPRPGGTPADAAMARCAIARRAREAGVPLQELSGPQP